MTTDATSLPDELDLSPSGRLSPRQRASLSRGAQSVLLVVVCVLFFLQLDWEMLRSHIFTLKAFRSFAQYIPLALWRTISYTLGAFGISLSFGMILALMKLSSIRVYRMLATAYIEFFRGLPALLIIFAVGYGVPIALGWTIPGITLKVAIALGIVSAAYMAESLRAGIQAVPRGQIEAARSLGMSHTRTMFHVVIPQAIRIVLPPVTNELILLTKDTSLVYVLGLKPTDYELAKLARSSLETPEGGLTSLFLIGACYLIITLPLGFLVRRMERSFGKAQK
jgi:polar amino acid transport system permease protein